MYTSTHQNVSFKCFFKNFYINYHHGQNHVFKCVIDLRLYLLLYIQRTAVHKCIRHNTVLNDIALYAECFVMLLYLT